MTMSTRSSSRKLRSPSAESPSKPSSDAQFRRLFTESDETQLLKAFLKISKHSIDTSSTITSPNLGRIQSSLGLRFSHSQIIDKLRRLRIKYHRQARTKSLIKTPHDLQLHKISRKIWGKKRPQPKRHRPKKLKLEPEPEPEPPQTDGGSHDFLENDDSVCLDEEKMRSLNERWIKLGMEEAELRARKAELVKEQMELLIQAFGSSSQTRL